MLRTVRRVFDILAAGGADIKGAVLLRHTLREICWLHPSGFLNVLGRIVNSHICQRVIRVADLVGLIDEQ